MATKPTAVQVAAGAKATASEWNNQAPYTMWRFLDVTKPICFLSQTVAQSIPNAAFAAITFDAETVDTDSQHSTVSNTSRVVIGNTLGWYRVTGHYITSANVSGKRLGAVISLNGASVSPEVLAWATGTTASGVQVVTLIQSTVNTDFVELQAFQETGGAVNTNVAAPFRSTLLVEYVGTLQ